MSQLAKRVHKLALQRSDDLLHLKLVPLATLQLLMDVLVLLKGEVLKGLELSSATFTRRPNISTACVATSIFATHSSLKVTSMASSPN